ncbi:hypothetical protein MM440_02755 [Arsenicicoccus piscis]|uniref:glycoside hydrolase family 26 protein n=1 Tax=Arsenicicoccus piscis TaxID=673954 RepID=UPI001F4D22A9|nr:glycosyl hydrolase [Arsenicicoccus piscis]MCH8626728.1 hypothetical protein [Arsenicicoccus piscis]
MTDASAAAAPAAAPGAAGAAGAPGAVAGTPIHYGSWTQGMDAKPALLTETGRTIGRPMSIASIFRGKGDTWPYPGDVQLGSGRILLVSWSLEDWGGYAWWAAGHGDAILKEQATRLKAYRGTVALRPWAEMNGDWAAHQPLPAGGQQKARGGTPAQFNAAWRRVVTLFRQQGVTNVRWVFNPTTDTYAGTTDIRSIWPGAGYVDVLGLDGYNWGDGAGLRWRSFTDIYTEQYRRLVALKPGAPVWICEISSADPTSRGAGPAVSAPAGQSKARWWLDMHAALRTGFPAVQAVVLFDANKERNWLVRSSPAAATGLAQALRTPVTRPSLAL